MKWIIRLAAGLGLVLIVMFAAKSRQPDADPGNSHKIDEVDSAGFEMVLGQGKPGIVEFYTTSCPWCAKLEPELAQVKATLKDDVFVVKMNANLQKNRSDVMAYEVEVVPTMVFFGLNGRFEVAVMGYKTSDEIYEIMKEYNLID